MPYSQFVTKSDDPALKDETIWVVELSDGTTIYQSDFKDDRNDKWLELKDLIENSELTINKMWIKFRSHLEEIPVGKTLSYVRGMGIDSVRGGQFESFVIGTELDQDNLSMTIWTAPELIKFGEAETKPKSKYLHRIIYNE